MNNRTNSFKKFDYYAILGVKAPTKEGNIQYNEEIENAYERQKHTINRLKVKNAMELDRTGNKERYQQEEAYIIQLQESIDRAYQQLRTKEGRKEYQEILQMEEAKEASRKQERKERMQAETARSGKKISSINPNDKGMSEAQYIRKIEEKQKEIQFTPVYKGEMGATPPKRKELQFTPIYKGKMGATPEKGRTKQQPRQIGRNSRQIEGEER